jgi:hypothetical protein
MPAVIFHKTCGSILAGISLRLRDEMQNICLLFGYLSVDNSPFAPGFPFFSEYGFFAQPQVFY